MLERLIDQLHRSGAELHVDDILDMLWLATRGRRLSLHGPSAAGGTQQRVVEPGPSAQCRAVIVASAKTEGKRKTAAQGIRCGCRPSSLPETPAARPERSRPPPWRSPRDRHSLGV